MIDEPADAIDGPADMIDDEKIVSDMFQSLSRSKELGV